jgi:hypothetical protein
MVLQLRPQKFQHIRQIADGAAVQGTRLTQTDMF